MAAHHQLNGQWKKITGAPSAKYAVSQIIGSPSSTRCAVPKMLHHLIYCVRCEVPKYIGLPSAKCAVQKFVAHHLQDVHYKKIIGPQCAVPIIGSPSNTCIVSEYYWLTIC